MTARELTIVDTETQRQATVLPAYGRAGGGWSYFCTDVPDDYKCKIIVVGYGTRTQAIHGAEAHLKWHVNGKPMCERCDSTLGRKGATRCRRGTCPAEER